MTLAPSPTPTDARLNQAGVWCLRLSEGELSHDDQAAFETWLDADPENRAAFDDAVRVWRAMEETSLSPDLIGLRRDALASFRKANRSKWAHGLSRRWGAAAAVAAGLVLLIGGAGLWRLLTPQIYETGVGERRVVVLADGSKLSLDAATKVEVRYFGARRDLKLDAGRAKFDVAKDPMRPFAVAAADKVVVATGTQFSVELVSRQVRVILYEGHVAVLQKHNDALAAVRLTHASGPADQVLTPGRELVSGVTAAEASVTRTDAARTLSWEGGQLVFIDEPLASAVERVNRYSKRKLAIGDPRAGQVLINGVYNAGDTAAFIEGVTGVAPVRIATQNGRDAFVSRR